MNLGIDATSTSSGGALVHINQLLQNLKYSTFGKIIIWVNTNKIKKKSKNKNISIINIKKNNLFWRLVWQRYTLTNELKKNNCHVLLCNSGYSLSKFANKVLIIQNFIPFNFKFFFPYFLSFKFIKFFILRQVLLNHLKTSSGIIFLNKYIKNDIVKRFKIKSNCKLTTIEHSIDLNFKLNTKNIKNSKKKWNIIYPSYIDIYKNHINFIKAVNNIKDKYRLNVTFLGEADLNYLNKLKMYIKKYKLHNIFKFKKYIDSRNKYYNFLNKFDIAVFLSDCENYPKTLIEIMKLKIPLVCSNAMPMRQITNKYSILCDQKKISSIEKKIIYCIENFEKINSHIQKVKIFYQNENEMSKKTFKFLNTFILKKKY